MSVSLSMAVQVIVPGEPTELDMLVLELSAFLVRRLRNKVIRVERVSGWDSSNVRIVIEDLDSLREALDAVGEFEGESGILGTIGPEVVLVRRISYSGRCVRRACVLIGKVIGDYSLGHIYKAMVVFWEVVKLPLRTIVYAEKKTTYEKPRKLINKYVKTAKLPKGVPVGIDTCYELRSKVIHRALILTRKNVEDARKSFCDAVRELTRELPGERIAELERIEELCQGI